VVISARRLRRDELTWRDGVLHVGDVVSSGCHGGSFCAMLGSTGPTNSDSTISFV
jgi:hypothetical protein